MVLCRLGEQERLVPWRCLLLELFTSWERRGCFLSFAFVPWGFKALPIVQTAPLFFCFLLGLQTRQS